MKEKTKCYWEGKNHQKSIVVTTHTILHTCLDIFLVKDVHDITISAFNINQTRKDLLGHLIGITDYDNYYILDGIGVRDKIEYKRNVIVKSEK